MEPFRAFRDLICTIPGIGGFTADIVVAETGADMTRFPTAQHLASCPRGRLRLARCVVDDGWTLHRAAERFQCSPATAKKWGRPLPRRWPGGQEAMVDRSSRPHRSPRRLAQRRERRIIKVRFTRRWGPHRIAAHLRLARSTVEAVLRRYRMPLLRDLDQASGLPVRRPRPHRYEHPAPGDLVHVDIKKLGRIPDGGGHRKVGRQAGRRNRSGMGYAYLQPLTAGLLADPRR